VIVIFEELEKISSLPPEERVTLFGNVKKSPSSNRLHRSSMMLNPLNLKHLNRLDELEADAVTLNLEDAIAPSRKKEALINIALFLSHLESSPSFVIVRTNPLDMGGREEIEFLDDFGFDAVRIAKVRRVAEIEEALSLVGDDKEIHISLETAEAFRDLSKWRGVDSRFTTANLGILDLLADLKLPQNALKTDNPLAMHILSRFLTDASIAGLRAVSFMYQDYRDTTGFEEWCHIEKSMGFGSKACMGPAQVKIANEIFGMERDALSRALEIKDAFEKNSASDINGFMHEKYGFIDEPIYKDALNTIEAFEKGR
jgi:citrate lyase subunit beta/citryl-CoA lyase